MRVIVDLLARAGRFLFDGPRRLSTLLVVTVICTPLLLLYRTIETGETPLWASRAHNIAGHILSGAGVVETIEPAAARRTLSPLVEPGPAALAWGFASRAIPPAFVSVLAGSAALLAIVFIAWRAAPVAWFFAFTASVLHPAIGDDLMEKPASALALACWIAATIFASGGGGRARRAGAEILAALAATASIAFAPHAIAAAWPRREGDLHRAFFIIPALVVGALAAGVAFAGVGDVLAERLGLGGIGARRVVYVFPAYWKEIAADPWLYLFGFLAVHGYRARAHSGAPGAVGMLFIFGIASFFAVPAIQLAQASPKLSGLGVPAYLFFLPVAAFGFVRLADELSAGDARWRDAIRGGAAIALLYIVTTAALQNIMIRLARSEAPSTSAIHDRAAMRKARRALPPERWILAPGFDDAVFGVERVVVDRVPRVKDAVAILSARDDIDLGGVLERRDAVGDAAGVCEAIGDGYRLCPPAFFLSAHEPGEAFVFPSGAESGL
ncbi:hypothetical protein K8I61_10755 [bacterium]|nr:hypothetical protein [bacterium]